MSGVSIKVTINDSQVAELLVKLQSRFGNLTPAMKLIGETVRSSVVKNFESGGRPVWKQSKRAAKTGGLTLTKSGRLRKSITYRASSDRVAIGTNLIYARIHQLGGEIKHPARERVLHFDKSSRFSRTRTAKYGMKVGGSAYTIVMPRREFLKVQPEDWAEIHRVLSEYLLG